MMQEQLLNSNNLKEKLKELGQFKEAPPNIQDWLNTVVHKHWLKRLPLETFTGNINEDWFQKQSQHTVFKQLVITPQFTSEVNHLIDFLKNSYKKDDFIYKSLNKLNYLECQRQAQKWIQKINDKASLEEDWDNLKPVEKVEFEGQEYMLYQLTSRQNLLREGKVMNNCISGYASKTDEENKGIKFYSLRDQDNKSLVSISAVVSEQEISQLERSEWITQRVILKTQLKTADDDMSQDKKDFEKYIKEMLEKRGFIQHISEIKEKNNELLDVYSPLVKKLINQLLIKKDSLSEIMQHVLDEINFTRLHCINEIHNSSKLPSYAKVSPLDELENEDYHHIAHIPVASLKKLKNKILEEPNGIPLNLMEKTNWLNISDQSEQDLYICSHHEFVKIQDSKVDIVYSSPAPNHFSFLNHCNDSHLSLTETNNILIKNSNSITFEIGENKTSKNRVSLVDCSIEKIDLGFSQRSKENLAHFLLIDSTLKNNEAKSSINITSINTKNNSIKQDTALKELDIYPFISSRYESTSIRMPVENLKDYIKEKIVFSRLVIDTSITQLKIKGLYDLEVSVPCTDKDLLMQCLESPEQFKNTIAQELSKNTLYQEDFFRYMNAQLPAEFVDFIKNQGRDEIIQINEKYKDDTNELNYTSVVIPHLKSLKDSEDKILTPMHLAKIECMKESYLASMHSSRMNNSKTKLSKNLSHALTNLMEREVFSKCLSDEAKELVFTAFNSPLKPELYSSLSSLNHFKGLKSL